MRSDGVAMQKSMGVGVEIGMAHQEELKEMIAERARKLAENELIF
jgi:hypothetical protein